MIKNSYSALLIFVVLLNSCRQDQAQESIIYFNDFETSNTILENKIDTSYTTYHNSSERFFEFNGSRNLGRFERGGITLELEGIESHQFVKLEFDLYIHDNWEGNGARGNTEDVFILNVDELNVHFSSIINTKCLTQDCETVQSFPNRINVRDNPENAGVTSPTLPGVCFFEGEIGGTKLIQFSDLYPHSSNRLKVNIAAGIKDAGVDLCLKSWSIDNLRITTVEMPNPR